MIGVFYVIVTMAIGSLVAIPLLGGLGFDVAWKILAGVTAVSLVLLLAWATWAERKQDYDDAGV